jgi:hypothetical protein
MACIAATENVFRMRAPVSGQHQDETGIVTNVTDFVISS